MGAYTPHAMPPPSRSVATSFVLAFALGLLPGPARCEDLAAARARFAEAMEAFFKRSPVEAGEMLEAAVASLRDVHGENHPEVAAARVNLGEALRRQGRAREAVEQLRVAAGVLRPGRPGVGPGVLAPVQLNLGRALLDLGEWDGAAEALEASIRHQVAAGEPALAMTLARLHLAHASLEAGGVAIPLEQLDAALGAYEAVPAKDPVRAYTLLEDLVPVARLLARMSERGLQRRALDRHDRWLAIVEATLGAGHVARVGSLLGRADVLAQLARYGEALRDLEEARQTVATRGEALAVFAPKIPLMTAGVHLERGDLGGAARALEDARAQGGGGPDARVDRALAGFLGAGLAVHCRDARRAAELLKASAGILEEALPPLPFRAALAIRRAEAELLAGDRARARRRLDAAVRALSKHLTSTHPEVATTRLKLAAVLARAGEGDAAAAAVLSARAALDRALGRDHPLRGKVEAAKGVVYAARGMHEKAHGAFRRARKLLAEVGIRDPGLLRDHARVLAAAGKQDVARRMLAAAARGCP